MQQEKKAVGLHLNTGGRKAAIRADLNATIDRVAHLFKQARESGEWSMYFSPINGESHFQEALGNSWEGQPVTLEPEPDNPHAIAVIAVDKIGYIPRNSWLHEHFPILQKRQQRIITRLLSINGGTDNKPSLGGVLEIGIEVAK
jgi:hypothetical protein